MFKVYRPISQWLKPLAAVAMTSALLIGTSAQAYQPLDKTIAIVGEEIIFSSELDKKLLQAKIRLQTRGIKDINEDRLRKQVLDNLVLERLQLNIAERNNISATKADVERVLKSTEQNLQKIGLSFDEYISLQKITKEQAIKEIEAEVKVQKVQQGAVNRRISVTEKEIDNFLSSKAGQEWLTPRFHLGHIFLPATEKTRSSALKQAKRIGKQLASQDFKRVAQQFSKGPNAAKGGDLGVQTKEEMPELFAQQIDQLKPGEISKPFSSPAGVHILKLFARNGAEPVVVKQYKARHILVKSSALFTEEEAKAKIDRLYKQLIAGADFRSLAEENTDDIGSKLKGGDLGWSSPGLFVPEFEKTMAETPVGEISKPFKSQFGWHVLQVQDSREKDIFDEVKRKQVTNILRRQRFQDELQIWLQELRDRTYVELLI